ncbi:STAS domain-containing protein [Sutcliffiella horikoshii]|uniref:STAS domain-containing protein n=1 Tax=Sutcliffiella horikoshii TaxID=79883 RepID=A0A5D4SJX0_9BACI|nr:STAS domain-containing protein [Sutcliffiella horikoshii]TYS62514.1 STAS domain-containing protein [Sutcliffiella horikoshii]
MNISDLTKDMEVTKNLGGGSLIGVPIYYKDGENYGTLCGMDLRPFHFTEKHKDLFKAMAKLLGNVLDLQKKNLQVQMLSVPLVPIFDDMAVLPLIGEVDSERTSRVIEHTLAEAAKGELEYIIIDLSGLARIDSRSVENLMLISNSLKLVGVRVTFTGIRPDLAKKVNLLQSTFEDITFKSTLKQAIQSIRKGS